MHVLGDTLIHPVIVLIQVVDIKDVVSYDNTVGVLGRYRLIVKRSAVLKPAVFCWWISTGVAAPHQIGSDVNELVFQLDTKRWLG